nr:unnamed protein product [Callosobruchus chinensis]
MNTTSKEFKRYEAVIMLDVFRFVRQCWKSIRKTHIFSTAFCGAMIRPVKEMDILTCIISTVGSSKIPMK